MNADDVLTTDGGLNDATDTNPSYEDLAYGGAGVDVLIANTGGDRLIDWSGELNSYLTPFSPFGLQTVSRDPSPGLQALLLAFAASEGSDPYLAAAHSSDQARNGEPFGELGMVLQSDAAWGDQHGGPRDPQPGNSHGGRDVRTHAGTLTIGSGPDVIDPPALTAAPTLPAGPLAPPTGRTTVDAQVDPTQTSVRYANIANSGALPLTFTAPTGSVVSYTVSDGRSTRPFSATVASGGRITVPVDVTGFADGALTVTASFVDLNQNTQAAPPQTLVKDTVAPTLSVSLPAGGGSYDVGSAIAATFTTSGAVVSALVDGRLSATGGTIDVDGLAAGVHTLVVTAADAAGNLVTSRVTFEVHATLAGLLAAVGDGAGRGLISSSMLSTLSSQIQSAMNGNSLHAKLPRAISSVQGAGASIDAGYASLLLSWMNDLLARS